MYDDAVLISSIIGIVWIHELFHIDWVSQAVQYGSNLHVTDIKIQVTLNSGASVWMVAYGPSLVKILARWGLIAGSWVIRNADSLSLYLLTRYVQYQLGNIYPHLPLAPKPPINVGTQFIATDDLFTIDSNGFATITNQTEEILVNWQPGSACANNDDEDGDSNPADILTWGANDYATQAAFPTDYLSSLSSWYGVTPTPTPTPTSTYNPYPACTTVNIASLDCNTNCCGYIPCPDWCIANCGGVDC
jgi:hypothetical protein